MSTKRKPWPFTFHWQAITLGYIVYTSPHIRVELCILIRYSTVRRDTLLVLSMLHFKIICLFIMYRLFLYGKSFVTEKLFWPLLQIIWYPRRMKVRHPNDSSIISIIINIWLYFGLVWCHLCGWLFSFLFWLHNYFN
jgi:hypothetical protein